MDSAPTHTELDEQSLLVAEAQLLLSEKRTSLSTIRTGIAVSALPLSIVSVLVATSKLYDASTNAHLLVPLLITCALVLALGLYLMLRAMVRLHHYDAMLRTLRTRNSRLAELLG